MLDVVADADFESLITQGLDDLLAMFFATGFDVKFEFDFTDLEATTVTGVQHLDNGLAGVCGL